MKDFCTYEQSLALKELGFDEPCRNWYDKLEKSFIIYSKFDIKNSVDFENGRGFTAPFISQAFRFFREKFGLYGSVRYLVLSYPNTHKIFHFLISKEVGDSIEFMQSPEHYKSYEEAEQACLNKLIEITKKK